MTEKRRRTQAERSATTRKVLLDAAVKCLFEHGYGATTTIMVAEEAGVSRGAMLHQFPSKADLMAFVIEADFEEESLLYEQLLAGITEPRERLLAYPEATWKAMSRPSGIAVLEILQGSRSDQTLKKKLAPVMERIEAHAREALAQEFPRGFSPPLFQLIVGTARGLSIGQVLTPEREDVAGAIHLLKGLLRLGIEHGAFASGAIPHRGGEAGVVEPSTKARAAPA